VLFRSRVVHEEAHLQGVPDALAPLVRACLAKDPEERPSTLQLSLRLKEIAAREAQGLADFRPPAPRGAEVERTAGRPADTYPEQERRRPSGQGPRSEGAGTPAPRPGAADRGSDPSPGGPGARPGGPGPADPQ